MVSRVSLSLSYSHREEQNETAHRCDAEERMACLML